ncbi:MAG: biopolymer transporter ExbD [Bacteroidetes bacterium]|uniref:Biopolymer transporter ExbD n=1 Tax=Candidatus Cryptobacteroides avistercoris TaxID=2840758 RepID=A0A9D9NP35_9BACT|nr:biopolymer transporter ExbD [Candidatus Cryptobacteroides avistercoris]
MALKRITKPDPNMSMSSMTDIVFLLLIFFLVTSTLVNPNALKLLLPKSTGQVGAKATVSVSIKDWGDDRYTYHINGDEAPVPFREVEDDLIGLLQTEEDPTFSIYADESVPIGQVVQVMNIAKRNHYKVILATQPE